MKKQLEEQMKRERELISKSEAGLSLQQKQIDENMKKLAEEQRKLEEKVKLESDLKMKKDLDSKKANLSVSKTDYLEV